MQVFAAETIKTNVREKNCLQLERKKRAMGGERGRCENQEIIRSLVLC